jgi:magnesium chelatase family protein
VDVAPVPRAELMDSGPRPEDTAAVATRVFNARAAARTRWARQGWTSNCEARGAVLRARAWRPDRSTLKAVERALDLGLLSARGYDRVLRVAWTLADLSGHTMPDAADVAEALFYRTGRSELAA